MSDLEKENLLTADKMNIHVLSRLYQDLISILWDEKANEILKAAINVGVDAYYDEAGSIGRRYARADEIGIFFSMTIDHQTLEDGTVTLRERDSKNQSRISIEDAINKVRR